MDQEMKLYHSIDELPKGKRLIATLGLFDGVHLGHQHLVKSTIRMARELDAESLVVTFTEHPLSILRPELPLPRTLISPDQKVAQLNRLGVDHLLILPFTLELSQLSAEDFVRPLIATGLLAMMLGYDNRFGRRIEGEETEAFNARLEALGLTIRRIKPLIIDGDTVSSSRIRALIAKADFAEAEKLLGRPYSIVGQVREGRQIGRTIGYPTANIVPYDDGVALPEVGVYISEVKKGNQIYPAMSYYGSTPTITPNGHILYRIEAYLFGFEGDLYEEELEIAFRHFLRPDQKFDGLEALRVQLKRDAEATQQFFKTHPLAL